MLTQRNKTQICQDFSSLKLLLPTVTIWCWWWHTSPGESLLVSSDHGVGENGELHIAGDRQLESVMVLGFSSSILVRILSWADWLWVNTELRLRCVNKSGVWSLPELYTAPLTALQIFRGGSQQTRNWELGKPPQQRPFCKSSDCKQCPIDNAMNIHFPGKRSI